MKTISTLFLLIICGNIAAAQSNEDYYNPETPKVNTFKIRNSEILVNRKRQERISNRLYFGVDGFLRMDKSSISNTFSGLIDTRSATKSGWSVSLGWINKEKWAMELEYARSPIHNMLIINGDLPAEYKMENDKNYLALRMKRRLLFWESSSMMRRSAFWIGAGAGIVPNSGKQKQYIKFEGYAWRRRGTVMDTLWLFSDTRTNAQITGFTDVTAEYVIKIAKGVDLNFYARKQWGLGTSLTTNLRYYVNKVQTQESVIKANGSGMTFGMSLRYVFAFGYDSGDKYRTE
ncbi:hypothetical protein [Dyadobacter sp. LHD-138]|uniref:hypothetical protein n=1 Tax=Dyadobacter sp. LHD-138 TaxID=3071413 RepID=UPI0027E05709|nr:hypothetical protein [Dyadobacter sp. LHD-138]MDQ6480613.1 hypothetical protein [Dyadobacter sp. LHD-138]